MLDDNCIVVSLFFRVEQLRFKTVGFHIPFYLKSLIFLFFAVYLFLFTFFKII